MSYNPNLMEYWDKHSAKLYGSGVRNDINLIKTRLHRAAEDIIAIGEALLRIKSAVDHGQFLPLIQFEFHMSERHAQRFMAVARRFAGKYDSVSHLAPTVLFELASPSTPGEVVDEVLSGAVEPTVEAIRQEREKLTLELPLGVVDEMVVDASESRQLAKTTIQENTQLRQELAQRDEVDAYRVEYRKERQREYVRDPRAIVADRLWQVLATADFNTLYIEDLARRAEQLHGDDYQVFVMRCKELAAGLLAITGQG